MRPTATDLATAERPGSVAQSSRGGGVPGQYPVRTGTDDDSALQVAKATVEKYVIRPKKPPSPTWRAFLDNDLVSIDFFVVPTVTFKVLSR